MRTPQTHVCTQSGVHFVVVASIVRNCTVSDALAIPIEVIGVISHHEYFDAAIHVYLLMSCQHGHDLSSLRMGERRELKRNYLSCRIVSKAVVFMNELVVTVRPCYACLQNERCVSSTRIIAEGLPTFGCYESNQSLVRIKRASPLDRACVCGSD